jgi:hypothetical protein
MKHRSVLKNIVNLFHINSRSLASAAAVPIPRPSTKPTPTPKHHLQTHDFVYKKIRISDVELSFVETEGNAEKDIVTFPGSLGETNRKLKLI